MRPLSPYLNILNIPPNFIYYVWVISLEIFQMCSLRIKCVYVYIILTHMHISSANLDLLCSY